MSGLNTAFGLIFGGCCSNVFTLEAIVKHEPGTGLLITITQFLLTALFALPSQLKTSSTSSGFRFTPPKIPLSRLALLSLMFFAVNMLNNWAFAFNISVPMHIILRSFGSVQTMCVGYLVGKRYSRLQVASVVALTVGVVVSAWADASRKGKLDSSSSGSTSSYTTGLFLLFTAQLISAYMGVVTESTYKAYGRHWGEVLFYTHILSFVFSLAFAPTILNQWHRLMAHGASMSKSSLKVIDQSTMPDDAGLATPKSLTFLPISLLQNLESYMPYVNSANRAIAAYTPTSPLALLFLNSLTQIACISGVNRLSASTTAVTVTVVLNIRKLVSFLLSCIIFGNPVSGMMAVGAGIVFAAGAVYGWDSSRSSGEKKRDGEERTGDQKQAIGNVAATASGGNAEAAGQNELRKRVT